MSRKEKIKKDIESTENRIKNLQLKLKNLYEQKKKLEDTEILQAVHSIEVTPEELQKILSNIKEFKKPEEITSNDKKEIVVYEK